MELGERDREMARQVSATFCNAGFQVIQKRPDANADVTCHLSCGHETGQTQGAQKGKRNIRRGKDKRLTDEKRSRLLKRRQAIEPIIGYLKADHRMDRCHLKGSEVDALQAVLCAAGHHIRWSLRMIVKKGLGLLLWLL